MDQPQLNPELSTLNGRLFITGMKYPLSAGDYWAELFARPTTVLYVHSGRSWIVRWNRNITPYQENINK